MSDTIAKAIKAAEDVEQQGHFRLVRAATHGEEPGVYHEVLDRKAAEWVRVCAPLEVLANTRDADSGNWGRVVSFEDRDGVPHEWTVPIDMAHGDGGELARTLAKLGLDIEPTRKAREALAAYIAKWAPTGSLRCVDRTGWHGDAYVLPDRTFGGSERIVLQGRGTRKPSFGCTGTLEGWRREIAANAVGNSRLVFGVSMGFAGPLILPLGEESGGVHFYGPSSRGKTTILDVARSVPGVPAMSWRTTDNAAELLAFHACDSLLPLDEIGQASPRGLANMAYMLGNQQGKARMTAEAEMRAARTWRLLFISTGEQPVAAKLLEGGERMHAGQAVRVLEVPSTAGVSEEMGAFEDCHGRRPYEFAVHLKRVAELEQNGYAARAFLEHLTADRETHVEFARARRDLFVHQNVPEGAEGQVKRALARFGLTAAAGELATRFGITGWQPGTAAEGAARCFRDWLVERGGAGGAEVTTGLQQVRLFLEQHGDSRFDPAWDPQDRRTFTNRAGFRRFQEEEGWTYYVLPESWRVEVCKGLDPQMLAKRMADQGWLLSESGHLTRQVRVPGAGKIRAYVIPPAFTADQAALVPLLDDDGGGDEGDF